MAESCGHSRFNSLSIGVSVDDSRRAACPGGPGFSACHQVLPIACEGGRHHPFFISDHTVA